MPTGTRCSLMPYADRLSPKNRARQTASASIARGLATASASVRKRGGPTHALVPRTAPPPPSPGTTSKCRAHSTRARSSTATMGTFRRMTPGSTTGRTIKHDFSPVTVPSTSAPRDMRPARSTHQPQTPALFFVTDLSPETPVILGLPWLQRHNPAIDWASLSVTFNSDYCRALCCPEWLDNRAPVQRAPPKSFHDLHIPGEPILHASGQRRDAPNTPPIYRGAPQAQYGPAKQADG
ncbi:hypothetical protein CHGG_05511 [Chaetomium globosum CBS 148.51]|uniref:Uncharacterized protein n=1 Tax=Chaetomium globosum (strain ATCC 6205 / CBS 148.51 / DSM 1962 / NBRC 6347 / NRRL 1970) TaxID=306901 RepID=Q2H754_CHAGB|nr:uncharacterized protein CHGG_05511 [Chaetomium globosum CBS 148.51]EAQ88892.1 hypothetical protein CHGG_05511 [Chaetomium globosum CBS 148.51]